MTVDGVLLEMAMLADRLKMYVTAGRHQQAEYETRKCGQIQAEADKAEAQQQIAQLSEQIQSQDTEELYRMFTYGGIVAGAGVILGIIVTFIPKRRRRNDTWM